MLMIEMALPVLVTLALFRAKISPWVELQAYEAMAGAGSNLT
jgi:hypothetical protein